MSAMPVSNKRLRDLQRAVHLVGGLLLAAYIYTPVGQWPLVGPLVQFVVIPLLVATGMAMWQWSRLRKRLARDRALATQRASSA